MSLGIIREYNTPNFRVIVDAIEEHDLDLSYDEDGSIARGIDNGTYIAFCARARVFFRGQQIASDYLGNCVYDSLEQFGKMRQWYFRDMVHEVCREARKKILAQRAAYDEQYIRQEASNA